MIKRSALWPQSPAVRATQSRLATTCFHQFTTSHETKHSSCLSIEVNIWNMHSELSKTLHHSASQLYPHRYTGRTWHFVVLFFSRQRQLSDSTVVQNTTKSSARDSCLKWICCITAETGKYWLEHRISVNVARAAATAPKDLGLACSFHPTPHATFFMRVCS